MPGRRGPRRNRHGEVVPESEVDEEEEDPPLPPFESKYELDKQAISDTFNVLTNYNLKEQYDKHNLFYREEEFVKKKQKTISAMDKWGALGRGLGSYAPYVFILWMSFSGHSSFGK